MVQLPKRSVSSRDSSKLFVVFHDQRGIPGRADKKDTFTLGLEPTRRMGPTYGASFIHSNAMWGMEYLHRM